MGVRVLFSSSLMGFAWTSKQKSLTLLFGCKIYKIILAKKKSIQDGEIINSEKKSNFLLFGWKFEYFIELKVSKIILVV